MEQSSVFSIMDAWALALRSDASLLAWCASNAGGSPTFFVGYDPKHGPRVADCPYVSIVPDPEDSDETGQYAEELSFRIGVACVLNAEKGGRAESGNLVQLNAMRLAGEFGQRALNVIAGTAYLPEHVTSGYPPDHFPLVARVMTITTTVPAVLGSSRTWTES